MFLKAPQLLCLKKITTYIKNKIIVRVAKQRNSV